ncbi:MAG: hypothetical protein DHS20C18_09460 [Saprospiraceae bacterium]|nr:MAG: hypothetical protein DHS20C18_09460 [Saprospiraceae bacterium]
MKSNIRLLTEKDASAYRTLRLHSYQEAPLAFSESYEDEQHRTDTDFAQELKTVGNAPEWFVLGAFSESDQLIGFVKFRRDRRSKARHKSMIHAMYTDPAYRKQGVWRELIYSLLERVKQLEGLEQIHLWVLHSAVGGSASGFYKSCGFENQGPVVRKDLKMGAVYVDAEYMVMYLGE